MKSVRIHEHGGIETLRYEDAPEPTISSPDEVIVKLNFAALNHIDLWTRLGVTGMVIAMPHILGADGAGVVVQTGPDVENVRPGDEVCLYPYNGCGACEFCLAGRDFMCLHISCLGERLDGTYAEFVKLPAKNCFPIPGRFSFQQAAAFPLVFITLWRMLITNARLVPGETVLVIGVGGGVASAALQLAKKLGARVIVTSGSHAKLRLAREHGADHGINHKERDFVQEVKAITDGRGVDIVVDTVAGEVWQKSLASLAPGGRLVTCGATAGGQPEDDLTAIVSKHLRTYGSTLGSREEFRQVLSFLKTAQLKPIVDRVFLLKEAAAAQSYLAEAKQFGKVVLQIAE